MSANDNLAAALQGIREGTMDVLAPYLQSEWKRRASKEEFERESYISYEDLPPTIKEQIGLQQGQKIRKESLPLIGATAPVPVVAIDQTTGQMYVAGYTTKGAKVGSVTTPTTLLTEEQAKEAAKSGKTIIKPAIIKDKAKLLKDWKDKQLADYDEGIARIKNILENAKLNKEKYDPWVGVGWDVGKKTPVLGVAVDAYQKYKSPEEFQVFAADVGEYFQKYFRQPITGAQAGLQELRTLEPLAPSTGDRDMKLFIRKAANTLKKAQEKRDRLIKKINKFTDIPLDVPSTPMNGDTQQNQQPNLLTPQELEEVEKFGR